MNDETTSLPFDGEAPIDHSIGANIVIDYAELEADCNPGAPGGRTVYNSYDYETQEEADAALEDFFTRIIEAPDEEKN